MVVDGTVEFTFSVYVWRKCSECRIHSRNVTWYDATSRLVISYWNEKGSGAILASLY
jgi:hypothetical protein